MFKIKKKMLAICLVATMVLGTAITSNAATSATVKLTTAEYFRDSAVIGLGTSVLVSAANSQTSKYMVKAIPKNAPSGSIWVNKDTRKLEPGENFSSLPYSGGNGSWKLTLNVNLGYKDCTASGSIRLN